MFGKHFIAEHVKGIDSSGIRRVFELGASLPDPVDLSIGQPDFAVPDAVKRAMVQAIEQNHSGYTVTQGIPALRARISRQIQEEFQWDPGILVTCGVSGGLLLSLLACVNPGDEVLIGDPYFVSYCHLVRLVGGTPVLVDQYEDFGLHPERFEAAVTGRTKLIILASPGNPTGVVHDEAEVRRVCDLASRHDLLVISDEIYRELTYDGPSPSPARFASDRTLLLRGYGKSHAMTGLRIGYAAGPKEVITTMSRLQQYTFVCAPHPAQYGALQAMDTDMSNQVSDYRARRDQICKELEGAFEFVRPTGGFYVFPKVPDRFANATEFVDEAIRRNLLIIPGGTFSRRDTHFRISYAVPSAKIRAAGEILRSLAE